MNKETAQIVADAVTKIIDTVIKSDFSRETCLDYLVSAKASIVNTAAKFQEESDATSFCKSFLKNQEKNLEKGSAF